MAKRTITSCWKQYEKMSEDYLAGVKDPADILVKLHALTAKANRDEIGNALATLFVKPYINVPLRVEFTTEAEDGIPQWMSRYDEAAAIIYMHPVSIVRFINDCRNTTAEHTPVADEEAEFLLNRYRSFLKEIGKLPSIYVLFLAVLQRCAYLLEIAHLEKRGGIVEVAEGESYHTLLWAFKELELFAKKNYGISIRAHYGISWYESDWITGR